ncbi:MAG: hypothetical protein HQ503_06205 [Rhodospirillales bacterium]|nr:hypothetical protein [Rhodospirillales bacterium]
MTKRLYVRGNSAPSAETAFFNLLRDLARFARHNPGKIIVAELAPPLMALAAGAYKQAFDETAKRFRIEINEYSGAAHEYRLAASR